MNSPVTRANPANAARRSRLLFGLIAGFIVVAGVVAIVLSRSSDTTTAVATQPVVVTGQALSPLEDPANDASVGQSAPTIVGKDFVGKDRTIPTAGKRTLVAIVAHWCPHCQREVPRLVEWQASGTVPDDLDVVLLSTGVSEQNGNYPPSAWLEREQNPFPVLADDEESTAAQALGNAGFPTLVLIGADGKVVRRTSGEKTLEELTAFVAA